MQNQPQRVIVQSTKSEGTAAILGFLFGPLGLLYSTITGAIVMFFVNLGAAIFTLGIGLVFTWPICAVWRYMAAKKYNENLMAGANINQYVQPGITISSTGIDQNEL